MFELSEVMSKPNAMFDWASKVVYNGEMTSDEKEITKGMDAWAREIGKKGDAGHEIAELVRKTFAPEEISAPSELISMIFDEDSIGEFDDYREEIDPKNTIVAHDAIIEGNVDRSFLEHKIGVPVWHNLAAETDVSMQDLRRGGYRSVANLTNYLREALELKRVQKIMAAIDAAIVSGQPNYIAEGEALPTIDGTPPNLFNEIKGDAFAPRNKHALAIDFVAEPPFFQVSETHAAKTWYLDPRAPKMERPHSIQNLREKMGKMGGSNLNG